MSRDTQNLHVLYSVLIAQAH